MTWYWQRKNKVIVEKPVPVQLNPPQIVHDLLKSHAPGALCALRLSKENAQNIAVSVLYKAKLGKEERWKNDAFHTDTCSWLPWKMLLFPTNYSVFSALSSVPNVFLILFCTNYQPNVFFFMLRLCHCELVSLPWNWNSPFEFPCKSSCAV